MRSTQALLPGAVFETDRLLAPQQAIIAYDAAVTLGPVASETVPLADAFGRVLAVDAICRENVPAQPRSTMDGFAVRSADGIQPRRLAGAVRMGAAPPAALGSGEAMQIPTGGTLPDGADAVVPVEDAHIALDIVRVNAAPQPGEYVTPAGSDMSGGETAIEAGRRIGGPEMGVLATLGLVGVSVYRRPRFAIISTGDELVDAAQVPGIGQVRDFESLGNRRRTVRDGRAGRSPAPRERRSRSPPERLERGALPGGRRVPHGRLVGRRTRSHA